MILGWLKKRKMDRDELDELRSFAAEMEGVLESVDLLLSMQDEQDVALTDLLDIRYHKVPFRAGGVRFPFHRQVFPMPEPEVAIQRVRAIHHQAHHLMASVVLSDKELLLRRTPAQVMDLAHRVGRDLQEQIAMCLAGRVR